MNRTNQIILAMLCNTKSMKRIYKIPSNIKIYQARIQVKSPIQVKEGLLVGNMITNNRDQLYLILLNVEGRNISLRVIINQKDQIKLLRGVDLGERSIVQSKDKTIQTFRFANIDFDINNNHDKDFIKMRKQNK